MRTGSFAILLAFLAAIIACSTRLEARPERSYPEVSNLDFAAVRDGQYEGYYNYYSMADARVLVTVAGGRVTSIRLLKHLHFPFISGAKVVGRIVQEQSLAVDSVTGATGSSVVIKKAVELALRRGAEAPAR